MRAVDRAAAVLDGAVRVPPDQRVRAAAHIARTALEESVSVILAAHGAELRRARMSSRLTVLRVLADAETAARARTAWTGLSRACHRHAFELPPAEAEVRALLAHVTALTDRT